MDRREFVLRGLGVVAAGAGVAGGVLACGGDDGGTGLDGDGNGGGGNGGGGNGGDFDGTIQLTSEFTFVPDEVTINVGDTITWEYASGPDHTITPDGHNEWARQEMTEVGQTFQHTFNDAGTFDYYCEPHRSSGMTGTIVVEST